MVEVNNTTKTKIDTKLIQLVAEKFLHYYKKDKFELSIAFVSDKRIKELNRIYRQIDKTTDVLSFAGENNFLGELILNLNQIKKQARKLKHGIRRELIFIVVHGLLHLVGYNDETEKEREEMIKLGEKFIKNIKY